MGLISKIKQAIRVFRDEHTTPGQIKSLRRTKRIISQQVDVYVIFDHISDNIDDYFSDDIVPLYIAATAEEAIAAALRLTYIKYFDHYIAWCAIRGLKPGIDEPSFTQYVDDTLDGVNETIARDFKVIGSHLTVGGLLSVYRCYNNTVTTLGLPSETIIERMDLINRAETKEEEVEPGKVKTVLADISDPNSQSYSDPQNAAIYTVLNCKNIGELYGKISLFNVDKFLGDHKKGRAGIGDILKGVAEGMYGTKELPKHAKAVFNQAFKLDTDVVKKIQDSLK